MFFLKLNFGLFFSELYTEESCFQTLWITHWIQKDQNTFSRQTYFLSHHFWLLEPFFICTLFPNSLRNSTKMQLCHNKCLSKLSNLGNSCVTRSVSGEHASHWAPLPVISPSVGVGEKTRVHKLNLY